MRFARLAVLLCLAAILISEAACADEKPNVIVIFTDDHGFADLSAQGIFNDLQTPHIDQLAAGGVRMTSGYVTAPQCVPSRGGLLSGRYQNRFGLESNGLPLDGFNAQTTIAERLKRAGYATGMTGKWHLGPAPQIGDHGFDDVYYKNANRPGWANFDLDGNDRAPGPEHSKLYHLDANSQATCSFIRRHRNEPFFFYCAYRAPHVPLDAPPKYLKRFPGDMPERRRQALAMISAMDDGVGQIMETLREFGLEEKTLIFFIGDNGAPLKIHKLDAPGGGPGWDGSLNDPLNGEKGMLSEGGIRVPFLVYWKGRISGGRDYHHPVISLDVAATANALAGLPDDPQLDGVNLLPFLESDSAEAPHETLYWRWIAQSAVREGSWKYLRGGAREYLFDLDADVEEKRNLIDEHPEVAKRLSAKLLSWSAELAPPGLATKSMAETWERYFDHYLDGKPAAPPETPSPRSNRKGTAPALQGWVARNSRAAIHDGALRVTPEEGTRKRPFIAAASLKVQGPAEVTLQIRSGTGGRVGFAWRLQGQGDFPSDQTTTVELSKSADWQSLSKVLPAEGRIIHLRIQLPATQSDIRDIELKSGQGLQSKRWRFNSR